MIRLFDILFLIFDIVRPTCRTLGINITKILIFSRNISLNEALEMVGNDEEFQSQVNTITIFPPSTNSGYHTDEDSGDEDLVHINNLSGAQLRAPTEINLRLTTPVSEDDYSSEDHISLQMLIKRKIKTPSTQKNLRVKKKHYEWIQQDLSTNGTVFWHSQFKF